MDGAPVATSAERRTPEDPAAGPAGQFLYETFYGGALGGSAVALFFAALDTIMGRALFTPSVIGTALLTDIAPTRLTDVRLDMVALYSVVHFGAFLLLGAVVSRIYDLLGRSVGLTVAVTFTLLTLLFVAGSATILEGVGGVIGWPWVLTANLIAAIPMAIFLRRARDVD